MMKKFCIALAATAVLMTTTASAETINVATLSELREQGQLVQLQEVGGNCRYYGTLDQSQRAVRVEMKACHAEDGAIVQQPYTGTVKVDALPAPVGTRADMTQ